MYDWRMSETGPWSEDYKCVNVLGVRVDAVNLRQTLRSIDDWIMAGDRSYVCLAPVHNILACQQDAELKDMFNASGLTVPDGMPVVWIAWMHGHRRADRVYGPDLLQAACRQFVERGHSHYFFGAEPGVAEKLANRLQRDQPGLKVAGWHSPPFGPRSAQVNADQIERINAADPDIVWVALGSPAQERWMAENRPALNARVLIGVGAAFDFLTGRKPQAPRWLQRSGFEWLFRLATEPRRLWRRYLRYPLFILWYGLQVSGLRSYPAPATATPARRPPAAKPPLVLQPESVDILGVRVGAWEPEDLEAHILQTVRQGARAQLLHVNAHALNLAYEQPWLREFFNQAEVVFPDGYGAVLAARLLGAPFRFRVTYADWFWRLAAFCQQNDLSLYFLGGREGVAEQARDALQEKYPGLRVVGCHHGYFDQQAGSVEAQQLAAEINQLKPDLLVVGFGMPLQEGWLAENWEGLHVSVGLTGGAVFDYVSGRLPRPPQFLTEHGLEWLGRLIIEPRRLWRRYLLGNPLFLLRILRQRIFG
jgi:N-acetylglucosaminyldiphosphoundecaprenol N-acetyl-beta-D-mannosaminyltransferase